jgi:hypothetical protein
VHDGPRVRAALNEARNAVVGEVRLSVDPPDARARVGAEVVVAHVAVPLVAGAYEYTVTRPGYRPQSGIVTVRAAAVEEIVIRLDRVSAFVTVVTQPAEAEVWIDGVLQGVSKPRAASELHGTLEIDGLSLGEHTLEVRRRCYSSKRGSFTLESLTDVELVPVVLEDGRSTINVTANLPDATVFLNGDLQGQAPILVQNVCEGVHELDIRAPQGRHVGPLTVEPGAEHVVDALLKPTVALFASPSEEPPVHAAILNGIVKSLPLTSGVLRVFLHQEISEPMGVSALARLGEWRSAVGPNAQHHLVETSRVLAEDLSVQAVAVVSRMPSDPAHYTIEMFAAGAAHPDVFTWADDLAVSRQLLQSLDSRDSLFDYRLEGAILVDTPTAVRPVLVSTVGAHPYSGFIVARVDDVEFGTARDVYQHLELTRASETRLAIESPAGEVTQVHWPIVRRPRILWLHDATRHFNWLAIVYQFSAAVAHDPADRAMAQLNLAVGYMAVKNWEAARVLLHSLDESGVSPWPEGTISLLLGKCLEGLHRLSEAREMWQAASKSGGMLTDAGPAIAEQAKAWLAAMDAK